MQSNKQAVVLNAAMNEEPASPATPRSCRRSPYRLAAAAAVAVILAQTSTADPAAEGTTPGQAKLPQLISSTANSPSEKVALNIPAQSMSGALTDLGQQTGLTIIIETKVSKGVKAEALHGTYTADEALKKLLDPAGLRADYFDDKTVAIRLAKDHENLTKLISSSSIRLAQNQNDETQPNSPQGPASEASNAEGDKNPSANPDKESKNSPQQEVVVTGSRIVRHDLSAPSPVAVIGSEQIRDSGNVTVENTLNQMPQLASGMNSQTNANGGGNGSPSGVLSANLRALGATRTLVLVNGKRFISADQNGIVDLASIPDVLVDHVEVMTGGASAVYGSDAIAGAVNFILKKHFSGVESAVFRGQTSESDGQTNKFDLTIGGDFAEGRGNALVYGSYTQRDAVMFSGRQFSQFPLNDGGSVLTRGGSGNVPGTKIFLDAASLASLQGVTIPTTPTAGCTAVAGVRFGVGGTPLPWCDPEDRYNFAPDNYLQRPLSRAQLSGLASMEIGSGIEVYSELHFANTRNAFQQAPASSSLDTPGHAGLFIPNYATNSILSQPVREFLTLNAGLFDPGATGNATIPDTGRRGTETGPRHYEFERQALGTMGGLRGKFDMGGNDWSWDTFYQYQRSRADELTTGIWSQTRVGLGLDTVDAGGGNIQCAVGAAFGCVPLNPLGIDSITPEAAAFIAVPRTSREIFERKVAGGSITGEPFVLPAGPVGVALGAEYRKDRYSFLPGATDLAGEYDTASTAPIAGEYHLTEYFGEVRVPLLTDKPFVKSLAAEAAGRSSDYSNFGKATTWKLGLEWGLIDELRFRVAFNHALRAPTIGELFAPPVVGFTGATDPCDRTTATVDPRSAAVKALCVEQGIDAGSIDTFTSANQGSGLQTVGNPNLDPEKSDTFTIGAVARLQGINLAVDYFDVKIDNAVVSLSANQTYTECFSLLDNSSAACQRIRRTGSGQVNFVVSPLSNIGKLEVKGIDLQLDYASPLPRMMGLPGKGANLSLSLAASKLLKRSEDSVDCAGFLGGSCSGQDTLAVPALKAIFSAKWSSDPLYLGLQVRHTGNMDIFPGTTTAVRPVGAVTYFDLTGGGTIGISKSLEIRGGVNNLFDKQPPILGTSLGGDSNTDTSVYDVLGRRYFLALRVRF